MTRPLPKATASPRPAAAARTSVLGDHPARKRARVARALATVLDPHASPGARQIALDILGRAVPQLLALDARAAGLLATAGRW